MGRIRRKLSVDGEPLLQPIERAVHGSDQRYEFGWHPIGRQADTRRAGPDGGSLFRYRANRPQAAAQAQYHNHQHSSRKQGNRPGNIRHESFRRSFRQRFRIGCCSNRYPERSRRALLADHQTVVVLTGRAEIIESKGVSL